MNIIKYILTMICSVLIGTIMSIIFFHTCLFDNIKVFMYRGIAIIILSAIILLVLLVFMKIFIMKNLFDIKDIISIIIVFLCINITFFTLVPVTVERSVSVYTLCKIDDMGSINKDDAEELFINEYVMKNDAFGKRFDEQIVTGSLIKNKDGSYTLTDRGHNIVNLFKFIGKLYNADMKNLR